MLSRKNASDINPAANDWLLAETYGKRFPVGALTVWAGMPGAGKSTAAMDLAAQVSAGGGHVILSNVEDAEGRVRLNLEVAGADLSKVEFISPFFPRDTKEFSEIVREEQTSLIVLDPIGAHFGGVIYQEGEFRRIFKPIKELLEEVGCAMVGVHHTIGNLKKKAHPLHAVGGPQGSLKGTARSIWIFGPNPHDDEERVFAHVKDNCGADKAAVILEVDQIERKVPVARTGKSKSIQVPVLNVLDTEAEITASQVLHPEKDGQMGHRAIKKAAAAEWLTTYLCLGAQPQKSLKEDALQDGLSWATIRRASKDVGVIKGRKGFGPGSYVVWRLPDGHPDLIADESDEVPDVDVGPCCDDPDLSYDESGNIICDACGTYHGTQLSLDDDGAEADPLEAAFAAPSAEEGDAE